MNPEPSTRCTKSTEATLASHQSQSPIRFFSGVASQQAMRCVVGGLTQAPATAEHSCSLFSCFFPGTLLTELTSVIPLHTLINLPPSNICTGCQSFTCCHHFAVILIYTQFFSSLHHLQLPYISGLQRLHQPFRANQLAAQALTAPNSGLCQSSSQRPSVTRLTHRLSLARYCTRSAEALKPDRPRHCARAKPMRRTALSADSTTPSPHYQPC